MPLETTPSAPWLITGGAGYIGSHIVRQMRAVGRDVIVIDDLSTGLEERSAGSKFIKGSTLDLQLLEQTIRENGVVGILQLAGKKQITESFSDPLYYYEQNVTGLQTVLQAMKSTGVKQIVFSSSALAYGMAHDGPLTEDLDVHPESPYGKTKVIGEWLLQDAARAEDMSYIVLRYFNVAGSADPKLGDPQVYNLIPLIFDAIQRSVRPKIYGDDYPTPDGTCVRDYIHASDIASAHLVAIEHLEGRKTQEIYNVGRGKGSSVREVLAMIEKVTGHKINAEVIGRRHGDPAILVASVAKAKRDLGWTAQHNLEEIVASSWAAWQSQY